jgi:hypothetical protein
LETKHSYETQVLRAGYVSLEQNMLKVEKREIERVLAFWSYVSEDSKYASEYPEMWKLKSYLDLM